MVISLTDRLRIDQNLFANTGALDPILGIDTRLFIDPSLLRATDVPELAESYQKITTHFDAVLQLVAAVKTPGDRFWRRADRLLQFPEVKGICIGYSSDSTSGSGMGSALRKQLLESVVEISQAGAQNPAIFELVGIFEEGIGPDRISDMVAKIIAADLIRFTQRVCSDCGIQMKETRLSGLGVEEDLPFNPDTGEPIILVPKGILKDLPVATSFADVRWIAERNQALREELNALIGSAWKKVSIGEQKRALRGFFVAEPSTLAKIVEAYLNEVPTPYDFDDDPSGEATWYRRAKEIVGSAPLKLSLPSRPTIDQVEDVVTQICSHFQTLVEDNQLCKLLYDKNGDRKHESAAQLLFFGIASAYCQANNLDLSPEADAGRGPVDFKVSSGFEGKVLVEIKLSSNGQLAHGFEKQLPIYQRAEVTTRGIYLVIDYGGATDKRIESFWEIVASAEPPTPSVVWVDGIPRLSASKGNH